MTDHVEPPMEEATEQVAVIGLAGRFPGAQDVNQFWQNIRDGVESITHFTDEELEAQGVPPEWLKNSNYVKAGTVLDGFDKCPETPPTQNQHAHRSRETPATPDRKPPQERVRLHPA